MNSTNNNNKLFFFKENLLLNILVLVLSFLSSPSLLAQEVDPNGYNIFYYDDGAIASEGKFKDGKPNGIWKAYYPNEVLKSIGLKRNGLSDSTWLFFDKKGRETWKYEFADDKKNGCAQEFDTLGNVVKEMYYVNNVLQGEVREFYPSGELKRLVNFEDGKEAGMAYEYDKEGTIITEEVYDDGFLKEREQYNRYDENGKKTGTWREFYPDGTLKRVTNFKDGEKKGLYKEYNKKGKLIEISRMVNDTTSVNSDDIVLIELYKEYYPDGKVRLVGGISNGLKSGIYREYSEGGELINGYLYKKDTLLAEGMILFDGNYQGDWKEYYKTGELRATGTYEDGVKTGKWTYYYKSGKKEQEGNFKNNQLSGQWTWYYENGRTKRTEYYNYNGNLEGLVTEWDSLGNEIAKGEYFDGHQEGEWFYHVGDYKEVGAFTIGLKNGIWKYYYKNGKLAFTGLFDEGEPKGKHTYFFDNGLKQQEGKYSGGVKNGIWRTYNRRGEEIETIQYKNGEIFKINGFRVPPAVVEE